MVTSSIAHLARTTATTVALGKLCTTLSVTVSCACWVRVYSTPAYQSADLLRSVDQDPVGEHGVLMDLRFPASNLVLDLSPGIDTFSLETPASANLAVTVVNESGAAAAITVTFTRVQMEI